LLILSRKILRQGKSINNRLKTMKGIGEAENPMVFLEDAFPGATLLIPHVAFALSAQNQSIFIQGVW